MPNWKQILQEYVDTLETSLGTNVDAAGTTTVFARLRQIVDTYLADGTHGLAALETLIDNLEPSQFSYAGTVTGIVAAPKFQCSGLIGHGDNYFKNFWAYVVWDAAGGGAAPQGEKLECTGYDSATGDFTVAAFSVAIAVGDKVLLIHPSLAYILNLTPARAGYLDELDAANLPADIDTLLTRVTAAVALASVCTEVRLAELAAANMPADLDTLLTRITAAVALASVCTEVRLAELAAANMPADIDTLLTRVTAAVALASVCSEVRLAELAAANLPADIDGLKTSRDRQLFSMDFWSDPQEEIQVPAVAATLVITPVVNVADLPGGATIVRAIGMFKFRMVENTYDGANALDGATVADTSQVIQVKETTAGAYIDAINFADNQFTFTELGREGGDVFIGQVDVAAQVDADGSYTFQWKMRKADGDFINFNDVQMGLRIWYSV